MSALMLLLLLGLALVPHAPHGGPATATAAAAAAANPHSDSDSYTAMADTDACAHGGSCNIARHLNSSVAELHALCSADTACRCHNERWLKSDCGGTVHSSGTTLWVKDGAGPVPPAPPPPPPRPPSPPRPPPAPATGCAAIWPSPAVCAGTGVPVAVSPTLRITTASSSATVAQAIERYSGWIPRRSDPDAATVARLVVTVINASEHLGASTNYSYTLEVGGPNGETAATAVCGSPYAVAYALETFAQLVGPDGMIPFSRLGVVDFPQHPHRGLLLDVGRRFYPVPLLHDVIDAMSFSKMSVLHLVRDSSFHSIPLHSTLLHPAALLGPPLPTHLAFSLSPAFTTLADWVLPLRLAGSCTPQPPQPRSSVPLQHVADFPAFRIQSLAYPALTAQLGTQYYSQAEVLQLVEFAKTRGVRVVPEVDVPGHASGMRPLAASRVGVAPVATPALQYCNTTRQKTIFGDPAGESVRVIATLIAEMAALFPDELFHLGGDETLAVGRCSTASFGHFEAQAIAAVRTSRKTPMGWEEMFTDTGAAQPGESGFVLATWNGFNASAAAAKGFDAVECASGHFYIQEPIHYSRLWFDISGGTAAAGRPAGGGARATSASGAVIGGEVSIWGNPWCFAGVNCTRNDTPNQPAAEAGWMYDAAHDSQFEASVWSMLLPRSVVAAHAFWRFDPKVSPDDPLFVARYAGHAARIGQRFNATRGAGCPINCTCSASQRCGVPYRRLEPAAGANE